MHNIGQTTSVRPTDTITHSRLPHLSSLEVQYIGVPNQQSHQTSEAKFFNSMPDLFTYMEHPDNQQEVEEVYLTSADMSMNRASMLSNTSAMSAYNNDPSVILEVVNIT